MSRVTGPYLSDEKARYFFRSNPHRAQAAIQRFARRGLLYLGEWHTHAEPKPSPSFSDEDAMRTIFARSHLNTTALLLLIIGFAEPDDDIGIWYIDASSILRSVA